MHFRALRRLALTHVRRLDQEVGIPRPLDVDLLLDRLERHRGRPIDLHETTLTAGGPCGLWICQPDRDVIAFAADTTEMHKEHIILHELGHILPRHRGDCSLTAAVAPQLTPSVRVELIEHMLGRSAYAAVEEQEAEMIATLIRLVSQGAECGDRRRMTSSAARIDELFGR